MFSDFYLLVMSIDFSSTFQVKLIHHISLSCRVDCDGDISGKVDEKATQLHAIASLKVDRCYCSPSQHLSMTKTQVLLDATKPQDGVNGSAGGHAEEGQANGSEVLLPLSVALRFLCLSGDHPEYGWKCFLPRWCLSPL